MQLFIDLFLREFPQAPVSEGERVCMTRWGTGEAGPPWPGAKTQEVSCVAHGKKLVACNYVWQISILEIYME